MDCVESFLLVCCLQNKFISVSYYQNLDLQKNVLPKTSHSMIFRNEVFEVEAHFSCYYGLSHWE